LITADVSFGADLTEIGLGSDNHNSVGSKSGLLDKLDIGVTMDDNFGTFTGNPAFDYTVGLAFNLGGHDAAVDVEISAGLYLKTRLN
jgi:hypothetical protein